MAHPEYEAVRAKVDAFTTATAERRRDALACRRGCTACCEVELEVSEIEADAVREALRAIGAEALGRLARRLEARTRACVMLEDDGACAIYAARPLVCRTQGHALRYPAGTLPAGAIRAHAGGAEVTWCPLNYLERAPAPEDVLDAERVDVLLALVNRRSRERANEDRALRRTALSELALDAVDRERGTRTPR